VAVLRENAGVGCRYVDFSKTGMRTFSFAGQPIRKNTTKNWRSVVLEMVLDIALSSSVSYKMRGCFCKFWHRGVFMKRLFLSAGLLVSFLTMTGCVTRGVNFPADLNWIHRNQTSQVEVSKRLGAPVSVGNSSGTPTWTYGYYKYSLFSDSYTKELKFYWSDDRKVQDFSFNSSFPEDRNIVAPASPHK
jgi:hypothetical protein